MVPTVVPRLEEREFKRLSQFIETEVGIKMPPAKKILIESRLQKRLKNLNISDFREYCEYVFKESSRQELIEMIDAITTNKTDFMREPAHFDYLINKALPDVTGGTNKVNLWSAACSTGQEPYNLAMFMEEFRATHRAVEYDITATDISKSCLEKGMSALYSLKDIEDVSLNFKKKYFLKSKDPQSDQVKIKSLLRKRVHFQSINLMKDDYGLRESYHIVFCRNVLIYFDRENQQQVINRIVRHMRPGGYLFLGHSESMAGINSGLVSVASSIFRKKI
ncbi:MAG: methyltransferase domain-containing protein [Spirochaetales bacterium]|nr:methyltransferase domain-containing protein [Spirochaetales bacterium]